MSGNAFRKFITSLNPPARGKVFQYRFRDCHPCLFRFGIHLMNPMRIVLAASVAFNVGLLTLLVLFFSTSPLEKPAAPPTPEREAPAISLTADRPAEPPDSAPAPTAHPADPDDIASAADMRSLYQRLRSVGMDAERARRVVAATFLTDFHDEMRGVFEERFSNDFWRSQSHWEMQELYATEYIQKRRQMEAMLEEVTGAPAPDLFPYGHRRGLPGFTPEQQRGVRLIEEDYSLLQSKIHARARGSSMLPEDWEALRMLEEERRRDLAALLSEEELREYDLRNSQTSHQLRHGLRSFEPNEEEFRTIFSLKHEIDLAYGPQHGMPDEETRQARAEAEKAMNEQLRELLGEERFEEYQLSQDHSFTMLAGLTDRLGVPREKAREIHRMEQLVREKQREFQTDSDLNPDDIAEANQLLWEETRRTVEEALGEEAMEIYMNQGGWWLRNLQRQAQSSQP